jgi:hypothetical protein
VLLAACQPVPYSAGTGPRVFYTGDSVLWDSEAQVSEGFRRSGFRTAGATFPGTEIGWSADRIMEQVWGDEGRSAPDAVVVSSGNMNAIGGWTGDDAAQVGKVLDWSWPEGRCTVWVLPASVRHPGVGDDKESFTDVDTAAVVAGIRALAPARGARIADWDSYAADNPEWYAEDGVHHTEAGKAAYAAFVVDRTRRHCGI